MSFQRSLASSMNEIDFRVREAERLMGLKVHQVNVKLANSLAWLSVVASVR